MFTTVKTYAPDEVYLTFGGYTVEGWNSISVKKTIPTFKTIQGIRGKNTRVRNKNSHSIIEISVDMTSDLNALFSQIVSKDTELGGAVLHISLVDKSGTEVFESIEAYVTDHANRDYDNTLSARNWTIECLESKWNSAGNAPNSKSLFELF